MKAPQKISILDLERRGQIFFKNFLHHVKLEKKWNEMLFLSVENDHWTQFLWPKQNFRPFL